MAGGQIQAILGLDTVAHFAPESSVTPAAPGGASLAPNADGLTPCAAAQTAASSSYYTFDAIGAAYGLGALLADGQDGNGETIAVYELASHSPADVATYESCFGLTNPITTTAVDGGGGTVGGDGTIEADADIEEAATEAPGASIISYEGPNTTATGAYDTWNKIIVQDKAQVVTTSWGVCEPLAVTGNEIPSFTALFEQAATQGQTVLAAAGDSGSEGCYPNNSSTLEEVDYPASDAWVTAVGGTSRYSNGTETAWNDCQTTESTACAASHTDQAAGGGGQSRYEPRPSDQPNLLQWPNAQSCGTECREVPDLSSNAGVGMVAYANGEWGAYGGTSLASPLLAGLVADRNDGCVATSGLWATSLYSLASEGAYGTAFTDITSGNTDMTGSNGGLSQPPWGTTRRPVSAHRWLGASRVPR